MHQKLLKHYPHDIQILNQASDLQNVNKFEQLEKASILLINDKFMSKMIITFMCHGSPGTIVILDVAGKYATLYKRIKFCGGQAHSLDIHFVTTKYECYLSMSNKLPTFINTLD